MSTSSDCSDVFPQKGKPELKMKHLLTSGRVLGDHTDELRSFKGADSLESKFHRKIPGTRCWR